MNWHFFVIGKVLQTLKIYSLVLCHYSVVILNRLAYRKGIDLQLAIIPELCRKFPMVRVFIGGDGPKRPALEGMILQHDLSSRVQMVGEVPHERVRDFLVQGAWVAGDQWRLFQDYMNTF